MITQVLAAAAVAAAVGLPAKLAVAATPKEITVGYFMEWPMPFLAAKAAGTYDKELGVKVNWRAFDTGTAMSAAMASGDVQIAVSQGVPPFVFATPDGHLKLLHLWPGKFLQAAPADHSARCRETRWT